ncbi:MAG: membrane protein insertion efficiency factor YidD [Planctomycetia bacterium]
MLKPSRLPPEDSAETVTNEHRPCCHLPTAHADFLPRRLGQLIQRIPAAPAAVLVLLVRAYQVAISPWLGKHCRFYPSCSQYFILAVQKHGAFRGTVQGVRRICRCHPWHPGGYDPP